MSLVYADRVKETTTTSGTGIISLAGAVDGFQSFAGGIGNGNTCYYCITDGTDWEVGLGTVTDAATDTLSRDTVLASSNSDAAVDFGSGSKDVFCVVPAGHISGISWDNTTGQITVAGPLSVSGNISLTGTVDGVDVAALSSAVTTLDGDLTTAEGAISTLQGYVDQDVSNGANPTFGALTVTSIVLGGSASITAIATGTADNDKLATQGYVDDNAGGGGGTYVDVDGTVPLTGNWDIGDAIYIATDKVRARDAAGLQLLDDGGSGMTVSDVTDVANVNICKIDTASNLTPGNQPRWVSFYSNGTYCGSIKEYAAEGVIALEGQNGFYMSKGGTLYLGTGSSGINLYQPIVAASAGGIQLLCNNAARSVSAQSAYSQTANIFQVLGPGGSDVFFAIQPDGGILITPSASVTPANNGELVVEATSNTTLTFKLKGTDGTVRSGTITLS